MSLRLVNNTEAENKRLNKPNGFFTIIKVSHGSGVTAVEHSTHNPKMKGSNPSAGSGREKMARKVFFVTNKCGIGTTTLSMTTFSIMTLSITMQIYDTPHIRHRITLLVIILGVAFFTVMLSVVMLNVVMLSVVAPRHFVTTITTTCFGKLLLVLVSVLSNFILHKRCSEKIS
jgi:hypothetical protein